MDQIIYTVKVNDRSADKYKRTRRISILFSYLDCFSSDLEPNISKCFIDFKLKILHIKRMDFPLVHCFICL